MRIVFLSLAALALAAPAVASAQSYRTQAPVSPECQQRINNQRLTGGLIGAGVGALAGRSVSGRNARTEGGLLGAAVGAIAGSELARRRIVCDEVGYRGPLAQSDYSDPYRRSDWEDDYEYAAPRRVAAGRQNCGWGEASIARPDGSVERESVWMCRTPSGQWRPAER
jgi:hypothetical protein